MNSNFKDKFFMGVWLLCMLYLTGCVHYGQVRDDREGKLSRQSIFHPNAFDNYYLGFIEFDEFGELFDRGQLNRAMTLIQTAKNASPTKNAIVVTFIHGWKNNASDDSGNVWGFREELKSIANTKQYKNYSVIGLYLGWRGLTTKIPVVKELTFFNRRNAAIRIPGAHLTETLDRIMQETKSCVERCSEDRAPGTNSLSIIVGHSFGGMVLERSLTQSVVGDILKQEAARKEETRKCIDLRRNGQESVRCATARDIQPPADLIAMVNEAAPATEGKQLLDLLKHHKMKLMIQVNANEVREQPLFLSITSEGDAATGVGMPIGQYPSLITKHMRKYTKPSPPEITNQSAYYLHTMAHLPPMFSHRLGREKDEKIGKAIADLHGSPHCFLVDSLNERYCIVPIPNRYNDTPYWVMQMPREFVPDHSTIFRPVFHELLAQFIVNRVTTQGIKNRATIQLAPAEPEK